MARERAEGGGRGFIVILFTSFSGSLVSRISGAVQLSDFEINRMVGDIIFKGLWASKPETSGNNTNKWYYGNADTTFEPLNHLPDYCNDPSASWPIIEKYRISILDQLTEWCVDAKGVSPIFDTRPLRAAMIVFLLMQEANNA